jgi:predicted metal-dependent phosphoesterase TrpH
MPAYKIDLHHHCNTDPVDRLCYTDFELIDAALQAGLDAIAITPHGEVYQNLDAVAYAQKKGLLLIPGIEKRIEGREIVLLNVQPEEVSKTFTFSDLAALRAQKGDQLFVYAPHPFYPLGSCAGPILDQIKHLLDAVEYAHLYVSIYNAPNLKAQRWAQDHNKTLLCNSDSHALGMVGRNYSIIEAPALTPDALFTSLKSQKPVLVTRPYHLQEFIHFILCVLIPLELGRLLKKLS